jgi:hypothetical protein
MWFILALSAAFFNTGYKLSNQYLKLSGHKLTVLIKLFQVLIFLPFLFFVEWPTDIAFYCLALLTGPLVLLQDRAVFDFTAKYDAGPITRVEPLTIPFVFFTWLIISPSEFFRLVDNPLIACGIFACIASSIYFSFRMKKCDVSFSILKAMIPLIILMGTISLLAKSAIDYAPDIQGITVYAFIQSVSLVLLSPLLSKKKMESKEKQNYLLPSLGLSFILTAIIILRLYGFALTPNPAYVTAVMLTAPFWIMLFYKFKGPKETVDVKSGIGIVISVIIMSILVSMK